MVLVRDEGLQGMTENMFLLVHVWQGSVLSSSSPHHFDVN